MIYGYLTFGQAKIQLAARLNDPTKVFWQDAELGIYLTEALRTWNALTAFWRGDFAFPTVASTRWYDLTAVANTLRPYTVTDVDLYTSMEYSLLEPPTGATWSGSLQFDATDLLNAVQRRRDEMLSTVGCTLTRSTVGAVAGRITLADNVIDIRRVAYLPNSPGVAAPMYADDTWAEQSFNRGYTTAPAGTPGTPSTWLASTEPPISFDVDAPPAYAGFYELLTVNAGTALSLATPSTLSMPDDWTHVLRWGALADLLSQESYSRDPLRAAYCEQRYLLGLKLLFDAPALLAARIGNAPLQVDAVKSADYYRVGWEAEAAGTPDAALTAGLNLVALAPVPDAGPYSLTATVVENAPVPSADGDSFQVSRDDLQVVLDYAQHLAAFKEGGAEFSATIPLFQGFLRQAALYNSKLAQMGEFTVPLLGQAQREARLNPTLADTVDKVLAAEGGGQ